jgi:hypothetical protein
MPTAASPRVVPPSLNKATWDRVLRRRLWDACSMGCNRSSIDTARATSKPPRGKGKSRPRRTTSNKTKPLKMPARRERAGGARGRHRHPTRGNGMLVTFFILFSISQEGGGALS